MLTVDTIDDPRSWNDALRDLPCAHVLQTWEWGEFKRQTTGWQPQRLAFKRGSEVVGMASVGVRSVGPLKVMYAPKGPALAYNDPDITAAILDELQHRAKSTGAIWLKIDPDVIAATGVPGEEDDTPDETGTQVQQALTERGWFFSDEQPQFRNTVNIDLTQSEDDILAAMSGNTRRKVRTAAKKDVSIRPGSADDLRTLYDLYETTGDRNDFITRPFDYYKQAWAIFIEAGLAQPFIAEYDGKAIAHVILFHFGRKCWYFYGASSNAERNRMPNYALQWESMRWAKAQGYDIYDMWGAPNVFDESDSMWGVYEFKRGFRGTVTRHIGAWDYAPYPPLYTGYTQVMPRVINLMRRRA
ncbi:MAG: peptidoglycan bridge formation glycyltransferase FemA/FemB family protein [Chloroflexota bacterium]